MCHQAVLHRPNEDPRDRPTNLFLVAVRSGFNGPAVHFRTRNNTIHTQAAIAPVGSGERIIVAVDGRSEKALFGALCDRSLLAPVENLRLRTSVVLPGVLGSIARKQQNTRHGNDEGRAYEWVLRLCLTCDFHCLPRAKFRAGWDLLMRGSSPTPMRVSRYRTNTPKTLCRLKSISIKCFKFKSSLILNKKDTTARRVY